LAGAQGFDDFMPAGAQGLLPFLLPGAHGLADIFLPGAHGLMRFFAAGAQGLDGAHGFIAALALAIGEIALSAAGIGEIIAVAIASAGRARDRVLVCFIRISRVLGRAWVFEHAMPLGRKSRRFLTAAANAVRRTAARQSARTPGAP
jgi:hypothetical protein